MALARVNMVPEPEVGLTRELSPVSRPRVPLCAPVKTRALRGLLAARACVEASVLSALVRPLSMRVCGSLLTGRKRPVTRYRAMRGLG
jgi:hypothetical protein